MRSYKIKDFYIIFALSISICFYGFKIIKTFQNEFIFGTINSPYSDALGPWLHGSLVYYFEEFPISYIYRPSIGIFYSSIITIFSHFYYIPYFILVYSSIFSLFIILRSSYELNIVNLFTYIYFILDSDRIFSNLSPHSITPDFFSFSFTFIGIQSLVSGILSERLNLKLLGFIHLGIALSIRGLQLPGLLLFSILIIINSYLFGNNKKLYKHLIFNTLIILIGFIPFLFDIAVQKKYSVINNGEILVYCVYKMPYHAYSTDCQEEYIINNMAEKKILLYSSYLSFLQSKDGNIYIYNQIIGWIKYDSNQLVNPVLLTLFFLLFIIKVILNISRFSLNKILKLCKVVQPTTLVILFTLFSFYISGLLLFVFLGSPGEGRTLTNLKPALYFSIFYAIILPTKFKPPSNNYFMKYTYLLFIFIISLLYLANFILPKPFAERFNQLKKQDKVVFKLSDDIKKSISLWYNNEGNLFYSHSDFKPQWEIFYYTTITCPDNYWNQSYSKPCKIHFREEYEN